MEKGSHTQKFLFYDKAGCHILRDFYAALDNAVEDGVFP